MLELGYISVFISLVIIIYVGIRKTLIKTNSSSKKLRKITYVYFISIICWLLYLYIISFNGFIFDRSFPPKFPIFVFIPAVVIIIYILRYIKNNSFLIDVPKSWVINYQVFRVIMEQLILFTFINGIIPIEATFKGYNYEVLFASTAPFIAYFSITKKAIPAKITIAWNILGIIFLIIVVSIMIISFFFPEALGYNQAVVDINFTKLPLLLLPAFMVPSAIFMHLFSIIQLRKTKE